jgi:xanthine/uracil permease
MSHVAAKGRIRPGQSLKGWSAPVVLVIGVIVIPVALSVVSGNVSEPDENSYIRMAFATVAGATVAIVSVMGLLLDRIIRRASTATIAILSVIALVVVSWEVNAIRGAGETLLIRLGM